MALPAAATSLCTGKLGLYETQQATLGWAFYVQTSLPGQPLGAMYFTGNRGSIGNQTTGRDKPASQS